MANEHEAAEVQVTQLSQSAPQSPTSSMLSWSGRRAGTEMVSFRRGGEWYATLQGTDADGNWYESEDIGPCASREEAEAEARAAYAEDQQPVADIAFPQEEFWPVY